MRLQKLAENVLQERVQNLPGWQVEDNALRKTFTFPDFVGSIGFIIALGFAAEKAEHHPDLDLRYNKVTVTLSTHDSGGITENDFSLAEAADKIAP